MDYDSRAEIHDEQARKQRWALANEQSAAADQYAAYLKEEGQSEWWASQPDEKPDCQCRHDSPKHEHCCPLYAHP